MPFYDYEYVTNDGVTKTVERRMKISEMTSTIEVVDEGVVYRAVNVIRKPHAKMSSNWAVSDIDSFLPPENSPVIEQGQFYPGGE